MTTIQNATEAVALPPCSTGARGMGREDGDSNPLGIPPLNGDLFSAIAVKDLQGTHLYNYVLLAAMARLSLFEDRRVRQRVNYSALDVEELGSVYESLLDFQPIVTDQTEGMRFELPTGGERKSTGSYYTPPELVRELIESALVPVMQERLARAKDSDPTKDREKKQQAILSMSVCDPACGSGHFLLAAARRLGRELAKVRTGEDEPIPKEFHLAVRDVIAHSVYGVDLNPLAVDLCKLALWLEGHWTGKPLSFLDHRIKSGNSLGRGARPKGAAIHPRIINRT
jgi:type I restriction-modification system DNA methylase subunit